MEPLYFLSWDSRLMLFIYLLAESQLIISRISPSSSLPVTHSTKCSSSRTNCQFGYWRMELSGTLAAWTMCHQLFLLKLHQESTRRSVTCCIYKVVNQNSYRLVRFRLVWSRCSYSYYSYSYRCNVNFKTI